MRLKFKKSFMYGDQYIESSAQHRINTNVKKLNDIPFCKAIVNLRLYSCNK